MHYGGNECILHPNQCNSAVASKLQPATSTQDITSEIERRNVSFEKNEVKDSNLGIWV